MIIDSDLYNIQLITSSVHEAAKLPYTVKVSVEPKNPSYDSHKEALIQRKFIQFILDNFDRDNVGFSFDRYSMTATLNFRHEDDAAQFVFPLENYK